MQTAREYAISKGLAIPGRGKLSYDAHAAIKGFIDGGGQLSDWDANGKKKPIAKRAMKTAVPSKPKPVAKPKVVKPKETVAKAKATIAKPTKDYVPPKAKPFDANSVRHLRKENTIRVIDKSGSTINVDVCQNGHSITRCNCAEIKPSVWLQNIAESTEVIYREVNA